jgi:hypothetical protein
MHKFFIEALFKHIQYYNILKLTFFQIKNSVLPAKMLPPVKNVCNSPKGDLAWAYVYNSYGPNMKQTLTANNTPDAFNAVGIKDITVNDFSTLLKTVFPESHEMLEKSVLKEVAFDGIQGAVWYLPANNFYITTTSSCASPKDAPNATLSKQFVEALSKLCRGHVTYVRGVYYSAHLYDKIITNDSMNHITQYEPDSMAINAFTSLPISSLQRDISKLPTVKNHPVISNADSGIFDFFHVLGETTLMV